ncbi:hypothetical protein ACFQX6_02440 [Streptosporangium lutulentum]
MTAVLLFGGGWAVQEAGTGLISLPAESDSKTWIALGTMAVIGLLIGLVVAAASPRWPPSSRRWSCSRGPWSTPWTSGAPWA